MSERNFLDIPHLERICVIYAQKHLSYKEQIPDFKTRYPGILEGVLNMPCMQLGGKYLYPLLENQAAVLFYEMIKQHPFFNGNKRIACVSLMTFLAFNNKWLNTDWKILYRISLEVANSFPKDRDKVLLSLSDTIKECIFSIDVLKAEGA